MGISKTFNVFDLYGIIHLTRQLVLSIRGGSEENSQVSFRVIFKLPGKLETYSTWLLIVDI